MENAIVYGTGKYGRMFAEKHSDSFRVLFYVDGNQEKQGQLFFGKEIKSPETLKDYLDTLVIVAVQKDVEIRQYLLDIGCSKVQKFDGKQFVICNMEYDRAYDKAKTVYWSETHEPLHFDKPYACTSQLCNQSFFDAPFFQYWAEKFMPNLRDHFAATGQFSGRAKEEPVVYHRKLWEWVYISQALYERGCLAEGKKGVVFGVGEECTPDLYASFGCEILATDLGADESVAKGWMANGQNVGGNLQKLNQYHFCPSEVFKKKVSWRDVDMNHIPADIQGYDFGWSSCALEHLGSLDKGLAFIKNSLRTVHTGGVLVHTTEYNLVSNNDTLESEGLSVYRRRDIEKVVDELRAEGHYVFPIDWHSGEGVLDKFVDLPPYSKKDMHLRLRLSEYPCTSIGLIIVKDGLKKMEF